MSDKLRIFLRLGSIFFILVIVFCAYDVTMPPGSFITYTVIDKEFTHRPGSRYYKRGMWLYDGKNILWMVFPGCNTFNFAVKGDRLKVGYTRFFRLKKTMELSHQGSAVLRESGRVYLMLIFPLALFPCWLWQLWKKNFIR